MSSTGVGGTEPLYDLMEIFTWTPINGATEHGIPGHFPICVNFY